MQDAYQRQITDLRLSVTDLCNYRCRYCMPPEGVEKRAHGEICSYEELFLMDWYPLLNSLRIAAISTFVIFFAGLFFAYYIAKLPRLVKGVLDVVLTLPLVLPPTVVGYLLLRLLGPKRPVGAWFLSVFGVKLVMKQYIIEAESKGPASPFS